MSTFQRQCCAVLMGAFSFSALCTTIQAAGHLSDKITVGTNVWTLNVGPTVQATSVHPGATIEFVWNGNHNVYIHPSGDCSTTDRILVGTTSPASYTFTQADVGQNVAFSCDVGSHCASNGMLYTVAVEEPEPDLRIGSSVWRVPSGNSLPTQSSSVGETVEFQWSGNHNVYIHPTGDCSTNNRILVGTTSPSTYTFTQSDVGDVVFACDVGDHCEDGMIMTVNVAEVGAPAPPTSSPTVNQATSPPTFDDNQQGLVTNCDNLRSNPIQLTNKLTAHVVIDPLNNTLIAEFVLDDIAWIGMGFTENNNPSMPGSEAVIGLPDDNMVQKYNLKSRNVDFVLPMGAEQQTLTQTSIEQTETQTILKFTKRLVEEGEHAIAENEAIRYLFAYGSRNELSKHANYGSFELLANQCEVRNAQGVLVNAEQVNRNGDNTVDTVNLQRPLWVAHGACASVAWGILVPLAIGSSMIRKVLEDSFCLPSGWWFQIHRGLNTVAALLTVAAFSLAVRATNESALPGVPVDHFDKDRATHTLTGLIIFILTMLQALNGMLRPRAPKAPTKKEEDVKENKTSHEEQNDEENMEQTAKSSSLNVGKVPEKKTKARFGWEIGHRIFGFGLLAFTWWQVQDGLGLFAERFDEKNLDYVFWIVVSILAFGIVCGAFYQKLAY